MKIFTSFFFVLFICNFGFSQNVDKVNKTLQDLNSKTKPKIIFSLKKNLLKINVYKNTTLLREDKIYIDDLDVNGIFYDKKSKQITLKCINEYCVERKIHINGDKKVAKSSTLKFSDNDTLNIRVVNLLRNLITDVNNDKIKIVNNTVENQVSDLGNNMLSVNVIDLGYKIFTINYDMFFSNNKYSFSFPLSYGFVDKYFQLGVSLKYYFYKGEARYYSFGNINLKQSQISYFVAPDFLFGYDRLGNFIKYLGEIGLYFQMSNGLSFSVSGYLGGYNYLKTTTTNLKSKYIDYNIKICVGYRF